MSMPEMQLRRFIDRHAATVVWGNIVGPYIGQSGAWTFASDADAEIFATYAVKEPAPSLAATDLQAAGIPLPILCEGWSIL